MHDYRGHSQENRIHDAMKPVYDKQPADIMAVVSKIRPSNSRVSGGAKGREPNADLLLFDYFPGMNRLGRIIVIAGRR